MIRLAGVCISKTSDPGEGATEEEAKMNAVLALIRAGKEE